MHQGEYKSLRGMFPTAAGKIASNGPYAQVRTPATVQRQQQHDHSLLMARARLTQRQWKLLRHHEFSYSPDDLEFRQPPQIKDIYKIPGLTERDIELYKKYESHFTVNPPGRTFYERINSRVST